jgi:hypothetical protein
MNILKFFYIVSCLFLFVLSLSAQDNSLKPDFFESSGKIYVVIAVIVTIFIGIVALLFSLERRVSKLEKEDLDNN